MQAKGLATLLLGRWRGKWDQSDASDPASPAYVTVTVARRSSPVEQGSLRAVLWEEIAIVFGGLLDGMFRLLERATELQQRATRMQQTAERGLLSIEANSSARMLPTESVGGRGSGQHRWTVRSIPPGGGIPSRARHLRRHDWDTGNLPRPPGGHGSSWDGHTSANRHGQTAGRDANLSKYLRWPICDAFDEEDEYVVIGEFPGHDDSQITVEVKDGLLAIDSRIVECHKEFVLPASADPNSMEWALRNGILQVRLGKN